MWSLVIVSVKCSLVSRIKYEEEMKREEDEEERTTMCFGNNTNDKNEKLLSFL